MLISRECVKQIEKQEVVCKIKTDTFIQEHPEMNKYEEGNNNDIVQN